MPEEPTTPPVPPAVPPAWFWSAFADDDDGEPFDAVAFFNPYSGPPEGEDAWLAYVPAAVRDGYLDNAQSPAGAREVLAAGFTHDDHVAGARGFAAGGQLDQLEPGPALAGFAAGAWDDGLAVLSDDELIGVLSAARRLTSWAAAMELTAVAGLGSRRAADARAAGDLRQCDHVGDEVAAALTLTCRAADRLVSLAAAITRLPAVAAALAAGRIDMPKAIIFTSELAGLGDVGAAAVAALVAADAPGLTTGQLRGVLHRAVLALDPEAARKRRERAQKDARVECWTEAAGTWSLAGRDMPPAAVLAADQHIDAAARDLKAAGAGGTLEQLRARVFLALLTSRPLYTLLPGQDDGTLPGQAGGLPGQDDDTGGTAAGHQDGNGPGPADQDSNSAAGQDGDGGNGGNGGNGGGGSRRPPPGPGPDAPHGGAGLPPRPGRADRDRQLHHPAHHLARPGRRPRRGHRIRLPRRRRQPRPHRGHHRQHRLPLVPDHHQPRRPRHRARLRQERPTTTRRARPAQRPATTRRPVTTRRNRAIRHRATRPAPWPGTTRSPTTRPASRTTRHRQSPLAHRAHDQLAGDRDLRPRPRNLRLPAITSTTAPAQNQGPHLLLPRLPPPRHPLRRRPHHPAMTKAAGPANATAPPSAGATTAPSKHPAGTSNNPAQEPSPGPSPAHAPTPQHPAPTTHNPPLAPGSASIRTGRITVCSA